MLIFDKPRRCRTRLRFYPKARGRMAKRPVRRHADTPTRLPPGDPLAELEDITYTGGWLTNEFWHWLGT